VICSRFVLSYLWSFCEDVRLSPAISAAYEVAVAQMLCAVVRRANFKGQPKRVDEVHRVRKGCAV